MSILEAVLGNAFIIHKEKVNWSGRTVLACTLNGTSTVDDQWFFKSIRTQKIGPLCGHLPTAVLFLCYFFLQGILFCSWDVQDFFLLLLYRFELICFAWNLFLGNEAQKSNGQHLGLSAWGNTFSSLLRNINGFRSIVTLKSTKQCWFVLLICIKTNVFFILFEILIQCHFELLHLKSNHFFLLMKNQEFCYREKIFCLNSFRHVKTQASALRHTIVWNT